MIFPVKFPLKSTFIDDFPAISIAISMFDDTDSGIPNDLRLGVVRLRQDLGSSVQRFLAGIHRGKIYLSGRSVKAFRTIKTISTVTGCSQWQPPSSKPRGYLDLWRSNVASVLLVGGWALPLWKIWLRQLGWWNSQLFLESRKSM